MSKLPLQPLDIAREALRQLALKRVPPTPDNFRAAYAEIAGTPPESDFPSESLMRVSAALPRDTPERERLAVGFRRAVESADWSAVRDAVRKAFSATSTTRSSWPELLRDLVTLLDTPHQHLTRARTHPRTKTGRSRPHSRRKHDPPRNAVLAARRAGA